MKFKQKENILINGVLFGLIVASFTINYFKTKKVDKKLNSLGNHVNTNFNEFAKTYNQSLDFQDERYNGVSNELENIKDEIGTCYEHIEVLSKKLDKSEKIEV